MVGSHAESVPSVIGVETTLQIQLAARQVHEAKEKERGIMGGTPDVGLKREMTEVAKLMKSQEKIPISKLAGVMHPKEGNKTRASAQKRWLLENEASHPGKAATHEI